MKKLETCPHCNSTEPDHVCKILEMMNKVTLQAQKKRNREVWLKK